MFSLLTRTFAGSAHQIRLDLEENRLYANRRGGDMLSDSTAKAAVEQCGRWYVVQTRPQREALAEWHLQNQSFQTFLPKVSRSKRVGRRQVWASVPWFPGYLFVHLDLERQRWRSVGGTIGVVRLVGSGGRDGLPTPVPPGLVERFQKLGSRELQLRERLAAGDRVRVIGGPFDQLCGTLETVGDRERVTILLNILSSETRVSLSRATLMAA